MSQGPEPDEEPPLAVETSAAYWRRKHAELAVLRRGLDEEDAPPVEDVASLIAEKQRLRARRMARALEAAPALAESNLGLGARIPYGTARLDYLYQRYDLKLLQKRFAEWIYSIGSCARHLSLGLLASSGMGAVSATLTALDRYLPDGRCLLVPRQAYFETVHFANRYLHRLRVEQRTESSPLENNVLYLDSITPEDELARLCDQPIDRLAVLCADTTCWDAASRRITFLVDRAVQAGVPLLLVRSHLKLDCLGTEYGRLGSIVLCLPRPPRPAQVALARGLRRALLDTLALTGASFVPHHLFPLAHDPDFLRLNRERNRRMIANQEVATARLQARVHEASATRIRAYHHGCFLVVEPIIDGAWEIARAGESLRARLEAAAIHTRRAPSFGYDCVSLTQVTGVQYQTSALRVALPDYPAAELDRLVDATTDWAIHLDPT